jgi:crotonobetainyl-CoA:carnitine CoA-transferase CaiB-like acyl-CoA transferase
MTAPLEGVDWLGGVRVVDFSWLAAGPTGTLLLALMGADVIRVESTKALDSYRRGDARTGRMGPLFSAINVGKRSLTLNLKSERGRQLALDLVASADLVVENFSPGTLARLGLGYDVLRERKPDIVLVSASAAGQDGPQSQFAGFAPVFAALGGLAAVTGYEDGLPALYGRSVDARVGVACATAAIAGLTRRDRYGVGGHLDVSDQEVVACLVGDVLAAVAHSGVDARRTGNTSAGHPGEDCYRCAGSDRWVMVEIDGAEDAARALGVVAGDRDASAVAPDAHRRLGAGEEAEIHDLLASWIRRHTAEQVVEAFTRAGVAASIAREASDLWDDPHLDDRGFWRQIAPAAEGDSAVVLGLPFRASGPSVSRTPIDRPPGVGEHTDAVLSELGFSADAIAELRAADALT